MPKHYMDSDSGHKEKARALRKSMTKEERKLWYECLRSLPVKFQRQYPIGPYIVDFCCHSHRMIIELDGGQHYEEEQQAYDAKRTAYLGQYGYHVLRYSNLDILRHFDAVCEEIGRSIQ